MDDSALTIFIYFYTPLLTTTMNTHNNRNLCPYVAPQTETIDIQVESNFMVESFSSTFDFGESGVEDGGDI